MQALTVRLVMATWFVPFGGLQSEADLNVQPNSPKQDTPEPKQIYRATTGKYNVLTTTNPPTSIAPISHFGPTGRSTPR